MESSITKIHISKIVSGVKLMDDVAQSEVLSSKSKCIIAFFGGGMQTLMSEKDVHKNYKNPDGTRIRTDAITPGRIYTVCPKDEEFFANCM